MILFFLFFPDTGFDISCKLSPKETICMKCQNLFSGKQRHIFQNVCWNFSSMQRVNRVTILPPERKHWIWAVSLKRVLWHLRFALNLTNPSMRSVWTGSMFLPHRLSIRFVTKLRSFLFDQTVAMRMYSGVFVHTNPQFVWYVLVFKFCWRPSGLQF